jgi:hypothetical protein
MFCYISEKANWYLLDRRRRKQSYRRRRKQSYRRRRKQSDRQP